MNFRKRGIVASIKGSHCIVVTPDGTYEKIPLPSAELEVGAEVTYNRVLIPAGVKPLLTAAALLLFFMTPLLLHQAFVSEVAAYVSLDINPSLEFSVDRNSRVIDVKCLDKEAVDLIKQEDYQGENIYDALSRVIDKAVEQNYIKPDADNLIVSTVSAGATEKVPVDQKAVGRLVKKSVASKGRQAEVKTYATAAEIHDEASSKGITPGKYLLYEQLNKTGRPVSIGQVKENSIKKLVDEYQVEMMPDYKSFTVNKTGRNGQPQINVYNNGKSVPMREYLQRSQTKSSSPTKKNNGMRSWNKGYNWNSWNYPNSRSGGSNWSNGYNWNGGGNGNKGNDGGKDRNSLKRNNGNYGGNRSHGSKGSNGGKKSNNLLNPNKVNLYPGKQYPPATFQRQTKVYRPQTKAKKKSDGSQFKFNSRNNWNHSFHR